jgi:hypothetical protein
MQRVKKHLGRSALVQDFASAMSHGPDIFMLATTGTITPRTREWLVREASARRVRIVTWEAYDIEQLLGYHQCIRLSFLGIPADGDYLYGKLADIVDAAPQGFRLVCNRDARWVLIEAAAMATKNGQKLSIAHLLHRLFALDPIVEALWDTDAFSIRPSVDSMESLTNAQPRHPEWRTDLSTTNSMLSALKTADQLRLLPAKEPLDIFHLLVGAFMQESSSSIRWVVRSFTASAAQDEYDGKRRMLVERLRCAGLGCTSIDQEALIDQESIDPFDCEDQPDDALILSPAAAAFNADTPPASTVSKNPRDSE